MIHGYPITNTYGIEFKWYTTLAANPFLDCLSNTSQMNVPGHYLIEAIDNSNEGLAEILAANTQCTEQ
jgi:hypothetical protein